MKPILILLLCVVCVNAWGMTQEECKKHLEECQASGRDWCGCFDVSKRQEYLRKCDLSLNLISEATRISVEQASYHAQIATAYCLRAQLEER